jgi:hypothetical protein
MGYSAMAFSSASFPIINRVTYITAVHRCTCNLFTNSCVT